MRKQKTTDICTLKSFAEVPKRQRMLCSLHICFKFTREKRTPPTYLERWVLEKVLFLY